MMHGPTNIKVNSMLDDISAVSIRNWKMKTASWVGTYIIIFPQRSDVLCWMFVWDSLRMTCDESQGKPHRKCSVSLGSCFPWNNWKDVLNFMSRRSAFLGFVLEMFRIPVGCSKLKLYTVEYLFAPSSRTRALSWFMHSKTALAFRVTRNRYVSV